MTAHLRPGRPADAPALLPLMAELCAGDLAAANAAWEAALGPGPAGHELWVAAVGDTAAGLVVIEPSAQPHFELGSVDWIAVSPAERRHGLGRLLLGKAQERALALGWRQLHVSTFHTNRASLHLYIDCGFYPVATLPNYAGAGLHYVELVWEPRR